MQIGKCVITTMAFAGLFSLSGLAVAGEAEAAPSTRVIVKCGTNYNHCVALHRAYIKDGNRVGPIHIGYPGCTAPPETPCSNEDWFYVYR
jgi:hypothetical protein